MQGTFGHPMQQHMPARCAEAKRGYNSQLPSRRLDDNTLACGTMKFAGSSSSNFTNFILNQNIIGPIPPGVNRRTVRCNYFELS